MNEVLEQDLPVLLQAKAPEPVTRKRPSIGRSVRPLLEFSSPLPKVIFAVTQCVHRIQQDLVLVCIIPCLELTLNELLKLCGKRIGHRWKTPLHGEQIYTILVGPARSVNVPAKALCTSETEAAARWFSLLRTFLSSRHSPRDPDSLPEIGRNASPLTNSAPTLRYWQNDHSVDQHQRSQVKPPQTISVRHRDQTFPQPCLN